MHTTPYGSHAIEFTLERRDRATLEISVLPDGHVQVIAPLDATDEAIAERVRKRARWVRAQQADFAQFLPRTPPRRWVPGETHRYLGRQYRLRVAPDTIDHPPSVKLVGGFFAFTGVAFDDSKSLEHLLTAWYRERASTQMHRRLAQCLRLFSQPERFAPASIQLRTMRTHWGSMSPSGRLTLNPQLVQAPPDAIDYVIVHELCHRAVPDHSRAFYDLLTEVMPDWQRRKHRLERSLS
ncbi:M48 family metallopeptidase [Microbacterium keratanolyticum]